jgi:RNA polymerase primary sigma factor
MSTSSCRRREKIERPASDSLTTYLREIRAYPLLTRAEEIDLARGIRAGDQAAAERLVCGNLRFVVSVAKKYQHRGVALSDLVNEGNLGLLRAAARFDETKEVRFISYAVWWVRQSIVHFLADSAYALPLPVGRAGVVYRVNRTTDRLRQTLSREPTRREIAEASAIDETELDTTVPVARAPISLEAPLSEHEDAGLAEFIADEAQEGADEEIARRDLTDVVHGAMHHLGARQVAVLRMYFGLDGTEPMSLEEIGTEFGITRERVRQIKEKALSRLRRSVSSSALATFCG